MPIYLYIFKRKLFNYFRINLHESIFFIVDIYLSSLSIIFSNKGYNIKILYRHIFRFLHLNIYYEFGIFYNKFIEKLVSNISSDIYFLNIFVYKLCIHLYYARAPSFYYGMSEYFKYPPFIVITISFLGIAFWLRISEILEPILGKNKYINLIADNTFSIMINYLFALDIIRTFFAFISQKTKYCKDLDFNKYYSMDPTYIYLPRNVIQAGIIYFLACIVIPIIIQKIISNIKKYF